MLSVMIVIMPMIETTWLIVDNTFYNNTFILLNVVSKYVNILVCMYAIQYI